MGEAEAGRADGVARAAGFCAGFAGADLGTRILLAADFVAAVCWLWILRQTDFAGAVLAGMAGLRSGRLGFGGGQGEVLQGFGAVSGVGAGFGGLVALARLGWGATVAASRTTSVAGLSSRRPRKAAWRTRLSAVQVAKRTWATRVGLTQ